MSKRAPVLAGYTLPAGVTTSQHVRQMQAQLGVKQDGVWGPKTQSAFDSLVARGSEALKPYANSQYAGGTGGHAPIYNQQRPAGTQSYTPVSGYAQYYANASKAISMPQEESFLKRVYRDYHAQGKQKDMRFMDYFWEEAEKQSGSRREKQKLYWDAAARGNENPYLEGIQLPSNLGEDERPGGKTAFGLELKRDITHSAMLNTWQKDALKRVLDQNNTAFAEQLGWDIQKLGAEAAFAKYIPSNAGMFAREDQEAQWEKLFGAGRDEEWPTKVRSATYEAQESEFRAYGEMNLVELLQAREAHTAYINNLPAWERTRALNAAPSARYAEAQAELREIDREIRIRTKNDWPLTFDVPPTPAATPGPRQSPSPTPYPENTPSPTTKMKLAPTASIEECMNDPMKLGNKEKIFLAVIAAEAEASNPIMVQAIAWTAINRAKSKHYNGSTPYETVTNGGYSGYGNSVYNNAVEYFDTGFYSGGGERTHNNMRNLIGTALPIYRGHSDKDITNGAVEYRDARDPVPSQVLKRPELWEEVYIDGIDPNQMRFWRRLDG